MYRSNHTLQVGLLAVINELEKRINLIFLKRVTSEVKGEKLSKIKKANPPDTKGKLYDII